MRRWPLPGGRLEVLGAPPGEIEARSRAQARALVARHWDGLEAELAASVVYAAGDPELVLRLRLAGDPVGSARRGLAAGCRVLVDVRMVEAGLRLPAARDLAVAVRAAGADELARATGTTRAAAGVERCWEQFGAGGLVGIGNSPTALLAVLDLAQAAGPPACVVATCPGLQVAAEAKDALAASGLPHLLVAGSRGGSGLAAAALNFLLALDP